MHRERNAADKRFDENSRFRLVITITKGDKRSEILSRMSQGTVIAYKTLDDGVEAQNKFHELAKCLDGVGDFASYGFSAVVDERDGCVHNVLHLG